MPTVTSIRITSLHSYVPDGLTEAEYKKIKENDKKKLGKDLGRLGAHSFKSRSLQGWQEALDRGEAAHAMAPVGYKQQLKDGKIRKEDVPYMVRGGSWDHSDVDGARKAKWHKTDKAYAKGGEKKQQSASILGAGSGFNWTGKKRSKDDKSSSSVPGMS